MTSKQNQVFVPITDIRVAVLNATRPKLFLTQGYYKQTRPDSTVLNFKVLEQIYECLKEGQGELEATHFVNLVYYLEDMTPEVFVEAFLHFWRFACLVSVSSHEYPSEGSMEEHWLNVENLISCVTKSRENALNDPSIVDASLDIKYSFLIRHRDEVIYGCITK